jgi:hypothetical protein
MLFSIFASNPQRPWLNPPAIDPDAAAYIAAVEAADGQALEPGVIIAINNFVAGCKSDGIWTAIKASCILAGARTLSGALVPLVGGAPTNNNFVSGDYNRKTGLVGNGSTKYLNSNRNNNADPQDSQHFSVYVTTQRITAGRFYIGSNYNSSGATGMSDVDMRNRNTTSNASASNALGFIGNSRNNSSNFVSRVSGSPTTLTRTSQAPASVIIHVFGANAGSALRTDARLAFYSIGEAIDLALLDARVTALINAYGASIP